MHGGGRDAGRVGEGGNGLLTHGALSVGGERRLVDWLLLLGLDRLTALRRVGPDRVHGHWRIVTTGDGRGGGGGGNEKWRKEIRTREGAGCSMHERSEVFLRTYVLVSEPDSRCESLVPRLHRAESWAFNIYSTTISGSGSVFDMVAESTVSSSHQQSPCCDIPTIGQLHM